MKFELKNPFEPTGDQPTAIDELVAGLSRGDKFQTLLGATGTGKTFTIANVVNQVQKPTLVIAHNKTLAAQLASEFREFFPKNAVEYFVSYYDYYQPESYVPKIDLFIEKDSDINEEIDRLRLAATKALMTRRDVLIVASVSCIYGLGSPEAYRKATLSLFTRQKISLHTVASRLTEMQYERTNTDLARGTFRIKGDLLEIYPAYETFGLRVSFFGDEVEKITQVDPVSFEAQENIEEILIFPTRHYQMEDDDIAAPLHQIEDELAERLKYLRENNKLVEAQRLEQRTKYDLEMMTQLGYCNGIENYSRFFDRRKPGEPPYTLMDYFPKDYLLVIDESHMSVPQIRGMWHGEKARKNSLIDYGFRLPSAMDNRPLTYDEFARKLNQVIFTSATPAPYEISMSSQVVQQIIRPTGIVDPEVEVRKSEGQIPDLINEVEKRVKNGERVLVTTLTKHMAEDLTEYLQERDVKVRYIHYEVDTLERVEILRDLRRGLYDVLVGINLLREGLDLPEVSLVAILDADKEGFLRSRTALIQMIGRAARRVNGIVIMYADTVTGSMREAIDETDRRRAIQIKYNEDHGITPKTVEKTLRDIGDRLAEIQPEATTVEELDLTKVPKDQLSKLIKDLQRAMKAAAEDLQYERAALIRDQIMELKKQDIKVPKTVSAREVKKLKLI